MVLGEVVAAGEGEKCVREPVLGSRKMKIDVVDSHTPGCVVGDDLKLLLPPPECWD